MTNFQKVLVALIAFGMLLYIAAIGRAIDDSLSGVPPEVNAEGLAVVEQKPYHRRLWNRADAYALAQMAHGEIGSGTKDEQAQVMWCVLNRCDRNLGGYGEHPAEQIAAPNQFHGYSASNPVRQDLLDIAVDVLNRWQAEHEGETVERELESCYLFFYGDGVHNHFY